MMLLHAVLLALFCETARADWSETDFAYTDPVV